MKLPVLFIALLFAGCASTGGKDDASSPDAGKPDASKSAVKPAKRPDAGVRKVKEKPPADERPEVKESPADEPPEVEKKIQTRDLGMPTVVVPADYPREALDMGVEGYVILEFTVTKTGSLKDIKVIDSSPHGYFEHAAINAAYKFRYDPKIVNGEPVEVPRAQYKMLFKLEYLRSRR